MTKLFRIYYRRLSQVIGSPTPWAFLLAAVALGLLGEGASKLVDAWAGAQSITPGSLTIIAGLVILLLLTVFFNLPQMMRHVSEMIWPQRSGEPQVSESGFVKHRQGMIALVSRGDYVPAADALYYHGWDKVSGLPPVLMHSWLITGPDTGEKSSQSNAQQLKAEL